MSHSRRHHRAPHRLPAPLLTPCLQLPSPPTLSAFYPGFPEIKSFTSISNSVWCAGRYCWIDLMLTVKHTGCGPSRKCWLRDLSLRASTSDALWDQDSRGRWGEDHRASPLPSSNSLFHLYLHIWGGTASLHLEGRRPTVSRALLSRTWLLQVCA